MSERHYCSFCFKSDLEVSEVIKSGDAVICNECIDICVTIIKEHRASARADEAALNWQCGAV